MAPILFTAATLTAISGRAVTDEQAAAIHAWVITVVEAEIGTLPDPVPPGVAGVAVEVGAAVVPAPGGAGSTSLGSFSATYTTSTAVVTREQRRRLRRAVGKGRAFSITPASR